ncbi:three-Cys-motif partner protein TcmP [Micromonospora sp. DR5-3]|uniref:three-Cys-motif partner protein TcmP n=1 Tax=unclassified Micromonospora TaxID=2617518 RepID=UPI001651F93C|nr:MULTISPECIES: three-Cys-motif partner protein TcmP [unclassified Micromonospora]MCW3816303.1 three-Cys-motif partner protein TcmP [Micromonospora sp. DR5-3]
MSADFFQKRKAPAAFKHAILSRYPKVFAAKLGSTSRDNQVIFLDGYAGRGRYKDGEPGSPLLLARSADGLAGSRQIRGFFVERDEENAAALAKVLAESGTAMQYAVIPGDLDDHLGSVLQQCGGSPLFAFLDPFGTALAYPSLRQQLLQRRPGVTEVLLHFTASGVARMGGILRKARDRPLTGTEEKQVTRVDRFLGGLWWREYFKSESGDVTEERATLIAIRISDRFAQIVREQTGFRAVTIPIRPRPELLPKYVLALFTRSPEGLWAFADTLGSASLDWHAAWIAEDEGRRLQRDGNQGVLDLFSKPDWRFQPEDHERAGAPGWVSCIELNIRTLLEDGPFRLADRVVEVYGTVLGVAWGKHVKRAIKNLHAAGVVENSGIGSHYYRELVVPRQR